jgi:hypothetical protein
MANEKHPHRHFQPRRELRRTSSAWWQDEQPVPYTGSSADPLFDDYDAVERARWAPGYIGEGNYSSGDFRTDQDAINDYGYGGFKGDVGFDEVGDEQYGGGRYAAGPYEQANEYGGESFASGEGPFGRLRRELEVRHSRDPQEQSHNIRQPYRAGTRFPGAPGWRDAADWADPAGFRTYRPHAPHRPHERGHHEHGPHERGFNEHATRREHQGALERRRGPKNYRRSDESILDEVYLRLLTAHHIDSSDVSVEVHHGAATLAGTVPERRMKHAIENIVADVRGVEDVDNRIHVHRAGTHVRG